MMNANEGTFTVQLGDRWTEFPLPSEESFGWHDQPSMPNLLLLSLRSKDPQIVTQFRNTRTPLRVGLAQHGRLSVLLMRLGDVGIWESPRGWYPNMNPPEVVFGEGEHVTWQLVVLEAGFVSNLRLFTTGPEFSRVLRRMCAEQRASGPLTFAEADEEIDAWQRAVPNLEEAWRRCEVVSTAGD